MVYLYSILSTAFFIGFTIYVTREVNEKERRISDVWEEVTNTFEKDVEEENFLCDKTHKLKMLTRDRNRNHIGQIIGLLGIFISLAIIFIEMQK